MVADPRVRHEPPPRVAHVFEILTSTRQATKIVWTPLGRLFCPLPTVACPDLSSIRAPWGTASRPSDTTQTERCVHAAKEHIAQLAGWAARPTQSARRGGGGRRGPGQTPLACQGAVIGRTRKEGAGSIFPADSLGRKVIIVISSSNP